MTEPGDPPEFQPIASQEELDKRIGERLSRERSKFSDYDDLKAKAEKFDAAEAANQTELQKLQAEIAERDSKLADVPKQARSQAIRFASKATQKGFLDPEDALTFLADGIDLADDAAVEAGLDDLVKRKPHLVRVTTKKPPIRPKPKGGDDDEEVNPSEHKGKERAAAALRQFRNT